MRKIVSSGLSAAVLLGIGVYLTSRPAERVVMRPPVEPNQQLPVAIQPSAPETPEAPPVEEVAVNEPIVVEGALPLLSELETVLAGETLPGPEVIVSGELPPRPDVEPGHILHMPYADEPLEPTAFEEPRGDGEEAEPLLPDYHHHHAPCCPYQGRCLLPYRPR